MVHTMQRYSLGCRGLKCSLSELLSLISVELHLASSLAYSYISSRSLFEILIFHHLCTENILASLPIQFCLVTPSLNADCVLHKIN